MVLISGKLLQIPLYPQRDGLELLLRFLNGSLVVVLIFLPLLFFLTVQYAQYFLPLLSPLQSQYMMVNAIGVAVLALSVFPAASSLIAFVMFLLVFANCSTFWIKCVW